MKETKWYVHASVGFEIKKFKELFHDWRKVNENAFWRRTKKKNKNWKEIAEWTTSYFRLNIFPSLKLICADIYVFRSFVLVTTQRCAQLKFTTGKGYRVKWTVRHQRSKLERDSSRLEIVFDCHMNIAFISLKNQCKWNDGEHAGNAHTTSKHCLF